MKWRRPQEGDTRQRIRFAWVPTPVEHVDGKAYMVWLERYVLTTEYRQTFRKEKLVRGWHSAKRQTAAAAGAEKLTPSVPPKAEQLSLPLGIGPIQQAYRQAFQDTLARQLGVLP